MRHTEGFELLVQPINADGSSIFKLGSTVTVKFELRNAAGAPVALQFGVTHGPRGLEAHAWLESGDRVILGADEAARFAPLRAP